MSSIYKLLERFTSEYLEPACNEMAETAVEMAETAVEIFKFIGNAILLIILAITLPIWYVPFKIYQHKYE